MTMRTKRRVVTAKTERTLANINVVGVLAVGALSALGLSGSSELDPAIKNFSILAVLLGMGLLAVLILRRRPQRLVPRIRKRGMGRAERRFARRLRRRWISACRDSGLSREDKDPELLTIHVPRVVTMEAVPLGMKLVVQTIPGQPADVISTHIDRLASALGCWFRAEVVGPSTCQITAELHDPLHGIRDAGNSTSTDVVVGRCDDGRDAVIDLADAAHIAIQGMTRSGKSALCYTIFGQLVASEAIHVTGIDPNRVLLEPLSQATDPADFVLGADPVAALELLDRTCTLLDERLALLPAWGIAAIEVFSSSLPVHIVMLEEYAGLLRSAAAHDEGVKGPEKVGPKIKSRVGRLVSEGAKAGIRVILITQRMDASIVDGDSRGQFGVRITMAVDNGDAVRMLHPQATPETVQRVVAFPPGRCLFWQHRRESFMQADFTDYSSYRSRLGLPPAIEPDHISAAVDSHYDPAVEQIA